MAFALAHANKNLNARPHDENETPFSMGDGIAAEPPAPRRKKRPAAKMASRIAYNKPKPKKQSIGAWADFIFSKVVYWCNFLANLDYFNHFITFVILWASALVGIQTYPSMDGQPSLVAMDAAVLYIFTAECAVKLLACGYRPWEYVYYKGSVVFWNVFDFLVVVVCYLPLGAGMVTVIRLFRLLRVLKLVKALPELQVLVMGLLGSLSSIFYVALLLMLVFYLYGIICVSFFRDNDPVHFGTLETAFLTLFRMATFEDWTDVMYTELYGCDVYAYHFRQHWCTKPERAMGWAAAPFFVSFIVLSSLVVLNLFIGVIISNMNEARATLEKGDVQSTGAGESEFDQDAAIMRDLRDRMSGMSRAVAEMRDLMGDMQTEVERLESSARLRRNKYRNGEQSKTGWSRVMARYDNTARRIKEGLPLVSADENNKSTADDSVSGFTASTRNASLATMHDAERGLSTHTHGSRAP